jgi:NAD(P)-dependent dehydrogenase (short-subunit alcohol dehydrogenase family)
MTLRVLLISGAILLVLWLIARFIRTARYPLYDKVVLITGGSRGLGLVLARHVCAHGGNVAIIARDPDELMRAKTDLVPRGGKVLMVECDLLDADQIQSAVRKIIDRFGKIDILINNAGVFPFGPTHETSEESFDDVYELNVKAPYFLVAELAPLMAQRGKGAIVNVSTMVADYGAADLSLYGSSKAAINLLTKAWPAEYVPSRVRVNAVSPRTYAHRRD